MSNKNYQNYQNYNKGKRSVNEPIKEDDTLESVKEDDTLESVKEDDTLEPVEEDSFDNSDEIANQEPDEIEIGKVNCIRLKIRNKPSIGGSIVCLARVGDELAIDRSKYYDGWFKVTTVDGLKGFCKQDLVTIV